MEVNNNEFIDSFYNFKGLWNVPSKCGLKVVQNKNMTVFIVTELYDENPGTSVTNYCAQLASLLREDYNANPETLIFIEHVPGRGSKLENYSETFDKVSFKWDGKAFSDPKWDRISKEKVRTYCDINTEF